LARAACKLCERTWLPELAPAAAPAAWLAQREPAALLLLSPQAGRALAPRAAELRRAGQTRLTLIVGPEAGFDAAEEAALLAAGADAVALAPSILRIEHAAEAALAVTLHAWWSA
jgi:16S rRNA (uracil1498-N3)-methyltransferase